MLSLEPPPDGSLPARRTLRARAPLLAAQLATPIKAGVRVLVSGSTATLGVLIVVSAISLLAKVRTIFVALRVTISFVILVKVGALFVVLVLRGR